MTKFGWAFALIRSLFEAQHNPNPATNRKSSTPNQPNLSPLSNCYDNQIQKLPQPLQHWQRFKECEINSLRGATFFAVRCTGNFMELGKPALKQLISNSQIELMIAAHVYYPHLLAQSGRDDFDSISQGPVLVQCRRC